MTLCSVKGEARWDPLARLGVPGQRRPAGTLPGWILLLLSITIFTAHRSKCHSHVSALPANLPHPNAICRGMQRGSSRTLRRVRCGVERNGSFGECSG